MSRWQSWVLGSGSMLVLAGAALGLTAGRASGEGETMLGITPASQNVAMGQDFNVQVAVSNVQNLAAYDFTLKFNTDLIELVSVSNGTFLASTGRSPQCTGTGVADVNTSGEVHYGCTTEGIIQDGNGKFGPDGAGALATLSFRAKTSAATAGVSFAPDSLIEGIGTCGSTQGCSKTGLSSVEACFATADDHVCSGTGIYVTAQDGAIGIFDPSQPTPTGVPPTPTPPAAPPTPRSQTETQATVQAVLGAPGRTLPRSGTPAAGGLAADSNTANGATANNSSGNANNGGAANGTGGTNGGSASGGVAGSSGGRSGTGASGSGATAGGRTATGAPIAGYGPAPHENPWRGRSLVVMAMGAVVFGSGLVARRRRV